MNEKPRDVGTHPGDRHSKVRDRTYRVLTQPLLALDHSY